MDPSPTVAHRHLAILGSSRSAGDTNQALRFLARGGDVDIVDVNDLTLTPYDYDHRYSDEDDFPALCQRMVAAETLLFATPVYWYTMSTQLKMVFDRLSDLLTIAKPMGRALAGKRASFLAVGTQPTLAQGFEDPFWQTCDYFKMRYEPGLYLQTAEPFTLSDEDRQRLTAFAARLWS
ncbi:MAG: NAD(P)H-dependent oxidoreductase [Pseudomonadota bacterium]